MMKKRLFLTSLLMIFMLCVPAGASGGSVLFEPISVSVGARIWLGEQELYAAQGQTLYLQPSPYEKMLPIYEAPQAIDHIAVNGDRIALLTADHAILLNGKGKEQARHELASFREGDRFPAFVHSIRLWGDNIYLLAGSIDSNPQFDDSAVYCLDMKEGRLDKLDITSFANDHLIAIDIEGGMLYAASRQTGYINIIDLRGNRLTGLVSTDTSYADEYADLRVKNGSAYLLSSFGKLTEFKIDGHTSTVLFDAEFDKPTDTFFLRGEAAYIRAPGQRDMVAAPLSGWMDSITLLSDADELSPLQRAAYDEIKADHPQLGVKLVRYPDGRVLATQLMAGESDVDILSHQMMTVLHPLWLYRAGAVREIPADDEIRGLLAQYEGLESLVTFEGKLLGIPLMIFPNIWLTDTALFEKTGINIPQTPWSWDDFFAIGKELEAYNIANSSSYKLIADNTDIPYAFQQYLLSHQSILGENLPLDTQEFRSLVSGWISLRDRDLVYPLKGLSYQTPFSDGQTLFWIYQLDPWNRQFSYPGIRPPQGCDDCRFPVNTVSNFVNSQAKPEDGVNDYFHAYARMVLDPKNNDFLSKDRSDDSLRDTAIRTVLEHPVNMAIQWDVFHAIFTDHLPAYLSGDISLDQFIFSAQQQVDMILGE